jgi:adenylate kinase
MASECDRLVLDGHFCLLDKLGEPTTIPREIFAAIAPRAVVVVQDEPSRIVERLEERDGQRFELAIIVTFQSMERDYSSDIAKDLGVPHIVVRGESGFEEAIHLLSAALT